MVNTTFRAFPGRFTGGFIFPIGRWAAMFAALITIGFQSTYGDESLRVPTELVSVFAGEPPASVSQLQAMESHFQALFQNVRDAVVHIRIGASHGSGVLISPEGYVLSAAHVVGRMHDDIHVQLPDGRIARGETLGLHLQHDLALIRLRGSGPWPYIPIGQRSSLKVGSWCAALGHPGGFDIQRGPVLRVGRMLQHDSLLRSDCQLIGGDSGGPLVDMNGQVVGIHSRIGASLANNLHIPVDVIRDHWKELTSGKVAFGTSYIGVQGDSSSPQCEVRSVTPNSPAEKAGVRSGDVVTHFAGQRVFNFSELVMLVQMRKPGDPVTIKLERDGRPIDVLVHIGKRRQPEHET